MYHELSGEEIWTDQLPAFIRESIIPGKLRCLVWKGFNNSHTQLEILGCGKFPGKPPLTVLGKANFWLQCRRFLNKVYHIIYRQYSTLLYNVDNETKTENA